MGLSASRPLDRKDIEAGQLEKLRALLAAVRRDNPFYSQELRATGMDSDLASLNQFSKQVPFTLKPELSEDQLPYGQRTRSV